MKWMLKTPRGKDLREGLELAKEAGYDGAEIQIYDVPGGEAWEKLVRNEAERLGLLISVHAPSGDINLSSSNSGIRRESLSQVLDTIRSAAAVGAMSVTVHPGRLSSMRENRERQLSWMQEACGIISDLAGEFRINVGFENMEQRAKEVYTSIRLLDKLIGERNSYTGMTLDLAHLFTVDPDMDITGLRSMIMNVHISQYVKGSPHHSLMDPEGELSVSGCLRMIMDHGYDGTVAVEAKDDLGLSAARANLEILKASWREVRGAGG